MKKQKFNWAALVPALTIVVTAVTPTLRDFIQQMPQPTQSALAALFAVCAALIHPTKEVETKCDSE